MSQQQAKMPQTAVIVGGSLSGLMQGLQLKNRGCDVTILEKDSGEERVSHHAGVGFRSNVKALLDNNDSTHVTAAVALKASQFGLGTRPKVLVTGSNMRVTSWGHLYRILRANFDGLASSSCPSPPAPREGAGKARYVSGKRVTSLEYVDGIVTVRYVDVADGSEEHIDADVVIGADGIHSTVRDLVHAPTKQQYSGYIVWRAAIPEKLLSKESAEFLSDSVSVNQLVRTYTMCYTIPTDQGSFEPGERLINLVWYYNVAEDSDEMNRIFTDTNGVLHRNTVPPGLVKPEEWNRVRNTFKSRFAAPIAEVLALTEQPFVTKVNESICSQPTFFDGHGILVGDALTTLRPHTGGAAEQAAFHTLALEPVWNGEKTMDEWSREVRIYSKTAWLLARAVGVYGQGSTFALLGAIFNYAAFLVSCKLGNPNIDTV